MKRLEWWCVACLVSWILAPATAIVGGKQAAQPEPDTAVVFIQKHGRSSRVQGVKHSSHFNVYSFFGIRYAEPPVGSSRFQRPLRRYMSGDELATRPCAPCPQMSSTSPNTVIGSEDCLCLSIYAPRMPGEEKGCAVIVFFHGGNYKSGSSAYFGGSHFAQKDTILVTVQYRLGALGFLSTGQRAASGNNGLFDMHMAKTWVMDYIEFFGGDPDRIVYMGQGSGGSAASLLALSEEDSGAKGVIALSGAPLSLGAVRGEEDPKNHARTLAKLTKCPYTPAVKLVACLRNKTVEEIVMADSKIASSSVDTVKFLNDISGRSGPGARIEGQDDKRALPPLITEKPVESMKLKRRRCPLLTGVNSQETAKAVYGKYSNLLTGKLKTIDGFIQKELIGNLQGIVNGVEGLLPVPLGPSKLLENVAQYYQFASSSTVNVVEGLAKIAEATTDALFNLPAIQSVKAWSTSDSPAYMYSFEYLGNFTKGSHFLPGVALVENVTNNSGAKLTGPSHGDELAYLFEALDEEGNPIHEERSPKDDAVRENFVNLLAKFTRRGNTTGSPISMLNPDQYFIIGEEITLGKNFKLCQLGTWGVVNKVSDALCKNPLMQLPKVEIPKLPLVGKKVSDTILPVSVVPKSPPTNSDKENEIFGQTKPWSKLFY